MMQPFSDKERMDKLQREAKSGPQHKKNASSAGSVQPSTSKRTYPSSSKSSGEKKGAGEFIGEKFSNFK